MNRRSFLAAGVHWHGIRLPNAMDGVPNLTQPPIAADGGRFTYEFELPDAGTFWYHPHLGSAEQVARGLYGALVVQERDPPAVDRDLVWVLSDWRLDREARIRPDPILDCTAAPGSSHRVIDGFYRQRAYELVKMQYSAENWMLHCHVLEHQATGMTALVRVA